MNTQITSAKAEEDPKKPKTPPEAEDEKDEKESEEDEDEKESEDDGDGEESEDDEDEKPESEDDEDEDEEEDKGNSKTASKVDTRSLATILGLPSNASEPAKRTRAIKLGRLAQQVTALTGASNLDEASGRLQAMAEDAAQAVELKEANHKLRKAAATAERLTLLRRLANASIPGYTRGDIFVDAVDANGNRTVKPSAVYSEMKLSTLRGFVAAKLGGGKSAARAASANRAYSPAEPKASLSSLERRVASQFPQFTAEQVAEASARISAQESR